jgi:hypothetical protein
MLSANWRAQPPVAISSIVNGQVLTSPETAYQCGR